MAVKLAQTKAPVEIERLGLNALKGYVLEISKSYEYLLQGKILICPMCGKTLRADTLFYKNSEYPGNGGYFPICKTCCRMIAENRKSESEEPHETPESIARIMYMMNKPFLSNVYKTILEDGEKGERNRKFSGAFALYMKTVLGLPAYRNMTWKDSVLEDDENIEISKRKQTYVQIDEDIVEQGREYFGNIYNNEQLMFLEKERQDWCSRYEINTKAQMELVIQLSALKLQMNEAIRLGNPTKDLYKMYLDITAALNVQPRQSNADSFATGKSFGELIRAFEEHDPVELERDPVFEDYDNIGKLIDFYYKVGSAKGLGLDIEIPDGFDEEMRKFTVTKPSYEADGETEMTEKIFGKTNG